MCSGILSYGSSPKPKVCTTPARLPAINQTATSGVTLSPISRRWRILPQRGQDARLTQDAFPSPLSPPPDAERRQLSWKSWVARTAVHTTLWIRLAQNGHQGTWRGIIRHRS
jgi:hypothetical protein